MDLAGKPAASISISMKLSNPDYNQNIPAYMKNHSYVSMWLTIFLSLIFLCITWIASAEDSIKVKNDTIIEKDLSDVIRKALHKPPKVKPENAGSLLLLPIIGSNPATGFMLGVGGQHDIPFNNTTDGKPNNFFFQAGLSTSGNLVDLFASLNKNPEERPYYFFGSN